jgi:hypothetical protein
MEHAPSMIAPLPSAPQPGDKTERGDFTIAPKDKGQFFDIHCAYAADPLLHIDPSQATAWIAMTTWRLLLRVFGPAPRGPDEAQGASFRLRKVAAVIANGKNFALSPPHQSARAASISRWPSTWLLSTPDRSTAERFLVNQVWSHKDITFQVVPFGSALDKNGDPVLHIALKNPTLLFALRGLISDDPTELTTFIRDVWTRSENVDRILAIISGDPDDYSDEDEQVYDQLIETVRVEVLLTKIEGGIIFPQINVFAKLNISDATKWNTVRNTLAREIVYKDDFLGEGTHPLRRPEHTLTTQPRVLQGVHAVLHMPQRRPPVRHVQIHQAAGLERPYPA